MQQLVRKHDPQCVGVLLTGVTRVLDERLDLQHGLPQNRTLKMQSRRKRFAAQGMPRTDRRTAWVNVDVDDVRRKVWIVPLTKTASRRHEGERLTEVLPIAYRETVHDRFAVAPCHPFVGNQQVQRSTVTILEAHVRQSKDGLHRHTSAHGIPPSFERRGLNTGYATRVRFPPLPFT